MLRYILAVVIVSSALTSFCQPVGYLAGVVVDDSTRKPLAYVSVGLKNFPIGTTTDESGAFNLPMYDHIPFDTVVFSYVGYNFKLVPLLELQSGQEIALKQSPVKIKGIEVFPRPPEYYLKLAVRSIERLKPKEDFNSYAYYREELSENGQFLKREEAIFKSYYPMSDDTLKTQHRVLLHREEKNTKLLAFMKRQREKSYQKELKEAERTGDTSEVVEAGTDFGKLFGGPNMILALDLMKNTPEFMDSTLFKKYRYSFGESTSIGGEELMVIHYESKGKVNHIRTKGTIILDLNTYCPMNVTSSGLYIAPRWIKPILFVMGLRIRKPELDISINYEVFKDQWYPKSFRWSIDAHLTKSYLFRKDEQGKFNIGQVFIINEINSQGNSIPETLRYTYKKKLAEQVHPESNAHWFGH